MQVSSSGRSMLSSQILIELPIVVIGILFIFAARLWINDGLFIHNDGYQYLSIASNFMDGEFAKTSILHFDSERSHGLAPAPLTTFPFGYPLLLAILGATGLPLLWAGILISSMTLVATVVYLQYFSTLFSLTLRSRLCLYSWIAFNSSTYLYSTSVVSESLFTLLTTIVVILFLRAIKLHQSNQPYIKTLVLAHILIGLSYWVRYAGLFVFASTAIFFAIQLARQRQIFYFWGGFFLVIPASLIGLGFIRNTMLVGTWKGGNTLASGSAFSDLLYEITFSLHHLIFGSSAISDLGIAELLLGAIGLCFMFLCIRYYLNRLKPSLHGECILYIIMFLGIYCSAMIYAAMKSPISFDTRMFYPLLPSIGFVLTLIFLNLDKRFQDTAFGVGLTLLVIAFFSIYIILNFRHIPGNAEMPCHKKVEMLLAADLKPENDILSWLRRNSLDTDIIIGNNGHGIQYLLQRNTISLISLEYTDIKWNEYNLEKVATKFKADYLLAFNNDDCASENVVANTLLATIQRGIQSTNWLELVIANQHASLYRFKSLQSQSSK